MACTKFEYVKHYEQSQSLLPNTYIVVRIDGRAFTPFCKKHMFAKPNDLRCIKLMVRSGKEVMKKFTDIIIGYG